MSRYEQILQKDKLYIILYLHMGNSTHNKPQFIFRHTQDQKQQNLFPQSIMRILLQLVNGQVYQIYLDSSMTVQEFKHSIYYQISHTLEPKCMQLWHNKKSLQDAQFTGIVIFDSGVVRQKKAALAEISRIEVMSKIQDQITLETGVAVMECGHQMGRTSIIEFLTATVEQKKYELLCPFCFKEWSYEHCRKVGNLTKEENLHYMLQLNKNWMAQKTKSCPGCGQAILKDQINCNCVRCANPKCKFGHFCMVCLRKWKNIKSNQCGNIECTFYPYFNRVADMQLNLYSDASKIKTVNVIVPNHRLCPCCKFPIQHNDGCKHMVCPECKNSFCWVCLQVLKGNWNCGFHNQYCGFVAPRQQLK